jgi:hypothetical protein
LVLIVDRTLDLAVYMSESRAAQPLGSRLVCVCKEKKPLYRLVGLYKKALCLTLPIPHVPLCGGVEKKGAGGLKALLRGLLALRELSLLRRHRAHIRSFHVATRLRYADNNIERQSPAGD